MAKRIFQAVLIATGEENKLDPITRLIPSPMLPVLNRPAMSYNVELLARHGIKEILVSLYYLGGQIEAYFGSGRQWGVSLEYFLQRQAWGNAGSMKWAEHAIQSTFIVLPADRVVDLDIAKALDFHQSKNNIATVVICAQEALTDMTYQLNADMNITRMGSDLRRARSWVDTGIYIFEPSVFDLVPARTNCDAASQLIPALLEAGLPVGGYPLDGYWNPLSNFAMYFQAQKDFLSSEWHTDGIVNKTNSFRFLTLSGSQTERGIWTGRRFQIDSGVQVSPPVCIGDDTRILKDVELGPFAVIASNVIIDEEATIQNSVIFDHSYLGKLVNIDNRIVFRGMLIDVETGEYVQIDDQFLLSTTYRNIDEGGLRRIFDVFIASIFLTLTLPVSLFIGLFLFATTGRIFEREIRVSFNRDILDLETETLEDTFHLVRFNSKNRDGRPSRFGVWLERMELIRLPELLNVIAGDLCFIGVKPLSPDEAAQITEPWQKRRNDYYPGFSGLWYLQTNQDSKLDEALIADVYYVATRSWREDLRLLWQTLTRWPRRMREKSLTYSSILEN